MSRTERSGLTTMRPRSTDNVMRSTSAFGRVPIVQITVAAGIISPSRSATARSPTKVARVLVRTSTPRAASDRCAAIPRRSGSSGRRRGRSCSSVTLSSEAVTRE